MIKGQPIADMMILRDNTPGSIFIWIMLIMLLGIYLLNNISYIIWIKIKIEKLVSYRNLLEEKRESSIIKKVEIKNPIQQPQPVVQQRNQETLQRGDLKEEEFEQEMKVFYNLKRKKWF